MDYFTLQENEREREKRELERKGEERWSPEMLLIMKIYLSAAPVLDRRRGLKV